MKHIKLYKDLTLGQKILLLFLVLMSNLSVIFVSVHNVRAEEVTTEGSEADKPKVLRMVKETTYYEGSDEELRKEIDETIGKSASSCQKLEKDINERLRDMISSCSAVPGSKSCTQALFQCDEATESDQCEAFNDLTSSNSTEDLKRTLEGQKENLEKLEKNKEKLHDRQKQAQDAVDTSDAEISEIDEKISELGANLSETLTSNNTQTQQKFQEHQTAIKILEEQNNQLLTQIDEDKKRMIEFMTAERLTCNQESRDKAQKFYSRINACSTGRRNCSASFVSFVRNGRRSAAEWAASYGRSQRRKCLRTDGDGDFAVKYRSLSALIQNNEGQVKNLLNDIIKSKQELTRQIQITGQIGIINNKQSNLEYEQRSTELYKQKATLVETKTSKSNIVTSIELEIKRADDAIETQRKEIASTRRSTQAAFSSGTLNKLRESQLLAGSLLDEARMAAENSCECSGAIKTISDKSGEGFCESKSDDDVEEDGVELEGIATS